MSELPSQRRYDMVQTSSIDEVDFPPSYDELTYQNSTSNTVEQQTDEFIPPSYEDSTSLPAYNDVKKIKEDIARQEIIDVLFNMRNSDYEEDDELRIDGSRVGNDCVFICAFMISFIFNWIGLLVGYFVIFNLAGRYGSLAGFGASVIKWLFFLKYSKCCDDYLVMQYDYLWLIFCSLALMLLLRGFCAWFSVRKQRQMTPS